MKKKYFLTGIIFLICHNISNAQAPGTMAKKPDTLNRNQFLIVPGLLPNNRKDLLPRDSTAQLRKKVQQQNEQSNPKTEDPSPEQSPQTPPPTPHKYE